MDLSEPAAASTSAASTSVVRRPIRWKIFGIAATLLVMMIFVPLSSSLSLRRVGQQLEFLSSFYIELDQSLSDVRIPSGKASGTSPRSSQ